MQWKKERDLLIAQTMAFVQSVTGKVTSAESRTAARVAPLSVEDALEVALVEVEPVPARVPAKIALPVDVLPGDSFKPLKHSDLRNEIHQRVAAFRARQQLFDRDRDEYCKTMMAKARAASEAAIKISDSRSSKR